VLAQKLNEEIALRKAAESKFAQAEAELVHIKTRQAEMEETYLTANDWTFPEGYPRKDQMWPPWKKPRCSEE